MVEETLRPLADLTRILRSLSDLRPPVPRDFSAIGASPQRVACRSALDAVGVHQRNQDALAQATIGDADAIGGPFAADRLENGAAGQDQVGPVATDARM